MKSKAGLVSLVVASALAAQHLAQEWQPARPGYGYSFPRDHFAHDNFQTEWWYYTGNLQSQEGRRFGFELTFFRQGARLERAEEIPLTWRPDQIYLAHFALSDLDGREFFHTKRLNRSGPGLAGASSDAGRYWNGNWEVQWLDRQSGHQRLQAVSEQLSLTIDLRPAKPPVINGQSGVSVKGPLPHEASHYISFTRLQTAGTLDWKGKHYSVHGSSWMDHEFFSEPPDNQLAGWDWFAVQLDNNRELMLYRLRRKDGTAQKFSSGTYVDEKGAAHFLRGSDFTLTPGQTWHSKASGQQYPVAWHIFIPALDLELSETTRLENQELFSREAISPTYWEGAVNYAGRMGSGTVSGVGYLEMTGYAGAIRLSGD